MKKLITILIMMLFASSANAQFESNRKFKITALQDARLALFEDDKGNKPFTPNFILRASHLIKRDKDLNFNFFGAVEYEYGDLNGGSFNRVGVAFGLNFDEWIDNFEFQTMFGINEIYRGSDSYSAWSLNGSIIYNISNTLSIIAELQQLKRTDIKTQPFIYSGFIGVVYTPNLPKLLKHLNGLFK